MPLEPSLNPTVRPVAGKSLTQALIGHLATARNRVESPLQTAGWCNEEWSVLTRARVNTLLVGPDAITSQVLDAFQPVFRLPIARCQATALPLSARVEGTLIIEHLDRMNLASQRRLLEWIDAGTGSLQVVTTACCPLFPLVDAGRFLATLYYRLNVLYVLWRATED